MKLHKSGYMPGKDPITAVLESGTGFGYSNGGKE